jgi:spore coat protein CotH
MRALRVLAAVAILGTSAAADAQTADQLFDPRTLQDIQLFMNTRDLQLLRARYTEDRYYAADLQWRGIRIRNAAIRSHGGTSRSPIKPAFRVDFNRYNSRGQFLGLTSLVLDNELQDPGLFRERLAMAFYRRMGQVAPRESFCRLFINGEYQGAYGVVESLDTPLIAREFSDPTGFLFQYRLQDPYFGEYLGDEFGPYSAHFEAQNHEHDAASVLYGPIQQMIREINAPDDPVWRDLVEQYLDLSQFVTYLAIETFLADEDGVLGIHGINNFFLYRPTGSTRHRLLPWDKDKTFERADLGIFERGGANIWFTRAMAFPDLRDRYLETLEACARSAAQDDWLLEEVTATAAVVDAAVRADRRKSFSDEDYDDAVAFFKDFARRRPGFVLDDVARTRASAAGVKRRSSPW